MGSKPRPYSNLETGLYWSCYVLLLIFHWYQHYSKQPGKDDPFGDIQATFDIFQKILQLYFFIKSYN